MCRVLQGNVRAEVYVSQVYKTNFGLLKHLAPTLVAFACDVTREEFMTFASSSIAQSVAVRQTKMVLAAKSDGVVCTATTCERELLKIKQLEMNGRYINPQTRNIINVVHSSRKFDTIGDDLSKTKAYLLHDANSEDVYKSLHHMYAQETELLQEDQRVLLALFERVRDVREKAKKRKTVGDNIAAMTQTIAQTEYLDGIQHHLDRAQEHRSRTKLMMQSMMKLV